MNKSLSKAPKFLYERKPPSLCHDIYCTQPLILHCDSTKIWILGEYLGFSSQYLKEFDVKVLIEPHLASPLNGSCPIPEISYVINGRVLIPNLTNDAILLSTLQHFAQICRVMTTDLVVDLLSLIRSNPSKREQFHHIATNFSSRISVDPDNQFPTSVIVFKPDFSVHNNYSGSIQAKLSLGPVKRPPRKRKLPFYNQSNPQLLQGEADKLAALGVLAKSEDVGVHVVYVSPSLLLKKLQGGHQLVTAFNDYGQYNCIAPTDSTS